MFAVDPAAGTLLAASSRCLLWVVLSDEQAKAFDEPSMVYSSDFQIIRSAQEPLVEQNANGALHAF